MAKFAGFLKRLKNIPNGIAKGIVKGIGKLNDVYKTVKPYAKPIVDGLLTLVPGGSLIGKVAELGFDKASSTIDNLEKITNLPPNTILPLSPNDEFNKYNKNLRRIHPIISRYSNTK